MATLVPRLIKKPDSAIKRVSHHLTVLTRDVRNQARLKSRTFRIVFRMDGDRHGYWVESAAGIVVPKTVLKLEEEAKMSDEDRPKENFQKEEKYTKKEFEMGKDLFFGLVETPAQSAGVSQGLAYLYFSPEGLVEPAAVQLTNRNQLTWTLIVSPLTGHSDIIQKSVRLRDVKDEK